LDFKTKIEPTAKQNIFVELEKTFRRVRVRFYFRRILLSKFRNRGGGWFDRFGNKILAQFADRRGAGRGG